MSSKILGDVAIGEVRRWANTCDDEGGRLYALPLADAYDELRAENERLREIEDKYRLLRNNQNRLLADLEVNQTLKADNERLRLLLQRLYAWDHMDSAADGVFWRSEIDKALGRDKCREIDQTTPPATL